MKKNGISSNLTTNNHDPDDPDEGDDPNEGGDKSQPNTSNLHSDEIDEETIIKLRGDAIGDTMYSESFVVKTLLQFSDLHWNEKAEEDLCFLWDMTLEKDICDYLFNLSFPSIACSALVKYEEQRFTEIVIGILANMGSFDGAPAFRDGDVDVVLHFLETDDPLILIQVMRFLKAVLFKADELHFVSGDVLEKINFILNNSMNKDLIMGTLDVVSKITLDFKLEESLLNGSLVNSSLNAYQTFLKIGSVNCSASDCDLGLEQQNALTYLVQTVLNVCSYINASDSDRLLDDASKYTDKLVTELCNIFHYFKASLLSEDFKFYIEAFTVIFPVLNVCYQSDVFISLFKMIHLLNKSDIAHFLELAKYMISVGKLEQLKSDLRLCDCDKLRVLTLILEHKSECEFQFESNTVALIEECTSSK